MEKEKAPMREQSGSQAMLCVPVVTTIFADCFFNIFKICFACCLSFANNKPQPARTEYKRPSSYSPKASSTLGSGFAFGLEKLVINI